MNYLWAILSVIVVSFLLMTRNPEALSHPQFWAEDGYTFFKESYHYGAKSILMPYSGYLHFTPRITAYLSITFLPYEHIPFAYALVSYFAALSVVILIWIRTPFDSITKLFLSISIFIIPIGNEIFLNLTNIQWFSALAIPIIFISGVQKKYIILDSIVILLASLTGPFCILFLPAVLFFIYSDQPAYIKEKTFWPVLFCYFFCSAIQLLLLLQSNRIESELSMLDKIISSPHVIFLQFITLSGIETLYTNQTNYSILFFILAIIILWAFTTIKTKNKSLIFLTICCFLLIGGHIITFNASAYMLHPLYAGSRYFFIPIVFILWWVIIFSTKSFYKYLIIPIFIYYSYIVIFEIPTIAMKDEQWNIQAQKIRASNNELIVPINPEGWTMILNKKIRNGNHLE